MARALTTGETLTGELVRIQCFDGSFKTTLISAAPLRDAQGQIVGAIAIGEDITERYDTEQKLQESEALFRTVFELLPVGLFIADRRGRITHGNAAGRHIWQGLRHVGPEQYGEYKAWWADGGEPLELRDWGLIRAVGKGETSRGELLRIQCFDGTFKTVLNSAAPIRGEDGTITGAVAVNQDVSALARTQEQLRLAVRDREHILAVVAHDLRNPLSNISMRAEILRKKAARLPDESGIAADAGAVVESSLRMAGLVDDLLAISVVRSGGTMLKEEPVQPSQLLAMAVEQAAAQIAEAGLRLELAQDAQLPVIHVDLHRMMRVFANLLDNAVKFTEQGGRVVLRAEPAPGAVLFSIANAGAPLSDDELKHLFQPFWQAGHDDKRGSGLGLSICRSIIEAHGGTVWTEAAPGMRLKVLFLLPRCREKAAQAALDPGPAMGL